MIGYKREPTIPNQLLEYQVRFSRILGHFCRQENIHAKLVRVFRGPMVITYTLKIFYSNQSSLRILLSSGPILSKLSHVHPVRVVDSGSHVQIEIPSPILSSPTAKYLAQTTKGTTITLGLDQFGKPVPVNLSLHPAVLFVGPTRSGKTEAIKSVLYGVGSTMSFVICSQKVSSWLTFKENSSGFYSDPKEIKEKLKVISKVMGTWAEDGKPCPPLVVIVDDLGNLLSEEPEIAKILSRLASTGGEVGIYLLLATQSAGLRAGTGGQALEDNLTCRVVYRTSSNWSASKATGNNSQGVPELSGRPGDALCILDGRIIRMATGKLEEEKIMVINGNYNAYWGEILNSSLLPPLPKVKPARKLSLEERKIILQAHQEGTSINQIIKQVFGYKNGTTSSYIQEVLGDQPG